MEKIKKVAADSMPESVLSMLLVENRSLYMHCMHIQAKGVC